MAAGARSDVGPGRGPPPSPRIGSAARATAALEWALVELGLDPGLARDATPLSGTGNRGFAVEAGGRRLAVRLDGEETRGLVDRDLERRHARLARAAGVGPEVLLANGDRGVLVTAWVRGRRLDEARRPFDRRLLARVARCFRDLRALEGFGGFMDPWRRIDGYLADAGVSDPAGADAVGPLWPAAAALRERTSPRDVDAVPAHVDPTPENLIDDGRRVVMLDWEYSARTHPMWDPACFAVEAGLGPEEERALLECAGADREADGFDAWRAAVCLVSLTWCLARRRRAGADAWRWEAEIARRRGMWERRASSLPGPRP